MEVNEAVSLIFRGYLKTLESQQYTIIYNQIAYNSEFYKYITKWN